MKTFRLFVAFTLICFALSHPAHAVVPAPDGGYPNGNTAEGDSALFMLTTGGFNTANGYYALFSTTTGYNNTATGAQVLQNNTTGNYNTGTGSAALINNTMGSGNVATGDETLTHNTTGNYNTASGASALLNNTTGVNNTATGAQTLVGNIASNNTADGFQALYSNSTGARNTATGVTALFSNTAASNNTAVGYQALVTSSGANNIALGSNAGSSVTTGSNNIEIGAFGQASDTNTIRIGKGGLQRRAFMQGIHGVTTGQPNAIPVLIDSAGQLGTASSSRRFKHDVKPMDATSESILALKPVTFHYKSDDTNTAQFGLIAEEVAEVNPDLVVCDDKNEIYTVRYDAVNAMLLNEFLKEHKAFVQERRKLQELEANATRQQKQIDALIARLQKVSAQLEVSKAPQTVLNNQ